MGVQEARIPKPGSGTTCCGLFFGSINPNSTACWLKGKRCSGSSMLSCSKRKVTVAPVWGCSLMWLLRGPPFGFPLGPFKTSTLSFPVKTTHVGFAFGFPLKPTEKATLRLPHEKAHLWHVRHNQRLVIKWNTQSM